MKKVVNGVEVDMTPEEIEEIQGIWQAWEDATPEREQEATRVQLAATDVGMARVLEDLIAHLGVENKLPPTAQAKLRERRSLRELL